MAVIRDWEFVLDYIKFSVNIFFALISHLSYFSLVVGLSYENKSRLEQWLTSNVIIPCVEMMAYG